MKRFVSVLFLFTSALSALAQSIVVPNAFANAEGNSSVNDFLNSSTFRMQIVFDASQFAIPLGASGRIDSISFRIDGASTGDVLYSFGGGSVTASTTTRTPDSLSPVFGDNIGPDAVTIRNGAMSFGGLFQSGANPQPFGQTISSTTAFWYMPSQGNLLLDIRGVSGQAFFPGALDAQSTLGDSMSRVFAASNFATTGTADTLGLVTHFGLTIVPEPATWGLALVGSLMLMVFRSRK